MPATYKVLGQNNPSATTATSLYTVPSSTSTVVSTLTITNLAASAGTFRVAIRPAGESLVNKHYENLGSLKKFNLKGFKTKLLEILVFNLTGRSQLTINFKSDQYK